VSRDPQLWNFVDKEEVKSSKEISTIDREESQRTVDLVERDKVLKWEQSR
jgi:hypothetical protein